MALLPEMFAEPSIWRRYHSPLVSCSSRASCSKVSTPSGKWPHMMIEWLHRLRTTLAVRFAVKVRRQYGTGERWEQDEVLGDLLAGLVRRLLDAGAELRGEPALAAKVLAELDVVHRDAVLEDAGVHEVPQRLHQVARLPGLVLVHAHDAVAEVVVLAEDVRVRVVLHVVGALPLLRRATRGPSPRWSSGSSGPASSPTGRAGRCGRSPCCRGSSPRPGRPCPGSRPSATCWRGGARARSAPACAARR